MALATFINVIHAGADESQAPPVSVATDTLAATPVDYGAVIAYMRTLPPDTLIRIAFADTPATDAMLRIARRESGLGKRGAAVPFDAACSAANPRSSARGLFQTLSGWAGLAAVNNLTWANVVGPDCLDDVLLARAIYARSGLRPWSG